MRAILLGVLLAGASACDAATLQAPGPEPEYRPGEAGTVDHALCLLGFTAVPLRRTRATGHHLVEARLNGREPKKPRARAMTARRPRIAARQSRGPARIMRAAEAAVTPTAMSG